ncbi:hypothetical protein DF17_10610 [Streptomyces rimosus]|nr:hypothetical protein DF17_10610 [Streptomyces rimosus]
MSAICRIGYVNRPTLVRSAPCLADLSLNCVIRLASPKPVRQFMTQASWACSGTWLWTKSVQRSGSRPAASSWAAASRVFARSAVGSCGTVIACRSTTM